MVKQKFWFTEILKEVKSNDQMKHFMVHESQHPVHDTRKGPKTKKSFQHSQLRDKRWQDYKKYTARKLQASRAGIWLTLGQMQTTHGLLQCKLTCLYWTSNPSFHWLILSLPPFTEMTKNCYNEDTLYLYSTVYQLSLFCHPGQLGHSATQQTSIGN